MSPSFNIILVYGKDEKWKEQEKQSTMSRAREAEQQLAAKYYGFDGFPESMFVFFFIGGVLLSFPPWPGQPPGQGKTQ